MSRVEERSNHKPIKATPQQHIAHVVLIYPKLYACKSRGRLQDTNAYLQMLGTAQRQVEWCKYTKGEWTYELLIPRKSVEVKYEAGGKSGRVN